MNTSNLTDGELDLRIGSTETILKSTGHAICLIDLDTRKFIGINKDAEDILKRTSDEIKDVHLWDFTLSSYHTRQAKDWHDLQTFGSAEPQIKENYYPDGKPFVINVHRHVVQMPYKKVVVARLVTPGRYRRKVRLSTADRLCDITNKILFSLPLSLNLQTS